MARQSAPAPGASSQSTSTRPSVKSVFSTARQTFYACFFILWFCIDVALLGLVSQQIHRHGRYMADWPTGQLQHAMGLLLFATIFGLLFCLFHWAIGLTMYLPVFFAFAVWWGTAAGIIEATPFGHGLQCKHINDPSRFPANWVPFLGDCSRTTAIEGLAWAMFALSVAAFFFVITDKFSFTSKRAAVYESLAEEGHNQLVEKH